MKPKIGIIIIIFGTIIEWYDFAVFVYFAPFLAKAFLPTEHNSATALIYTYGIMGIGFVTRPLGGIVLGKIGDKYGRRFSLMLSGVIMLISMLMIILLPEYKYLGIFTVIILLFSRLAQGFAVGGEYTGSLVSTLELSEDILQKRRGMFTAFPVLISNIGWYLGFFMLSFVQLFLSNAQIQHFGFRIPFIIGAVLVLIFVALRPWISDGSVYTEATQKPNQNQLTFFTKKNTYLVIILSILAMSMGFLYFGIYTAVPLFLSKYMGYKTTLLVNLFWVVGFVFIFLSGWISDYVNHKVFFIIATFIIGICIYPIIQSIFYGNRLVGLSILFFLHHIIVIPFILILSQSFRAKERFFGVGLAYNIGNSISGFAPMIFLSIYHFSQNILSLGIVLAFCFLLNVVLVWPLNKKYYSPHKTLKEIENLN